MTLDELIIDLKAAGANENTIRLAMNCYELGQADEREACAKMAWDYGWKRVDSDDAQGAAIEITDLIRARGEA